MIWPLADPSGAKRSIRPTATSGSNASLILRLAIHTLAQGPNFTKAYPREEAGTPSSVAFASSPPAPEA